MRNHKVAIQGRIASYHDLAARKIYGEDVEIVECLTFKDMCQKLVDNTADYAVMAIENSTVGSILSNYSLIEHYNLSIIGELYARIEFHLLALTGLQLKDIDYIHSDPLAIIQCQEFLLANERIRVVEANDTASSAKNIALGKLMNAAAIGNEFIADRYGLNIIERNIESDKENYTRFLILSKATDKAERPDKASISFRIKHEPNALGNTLNLIGSNKINLSKIQSIPIAGKQDEYVFHIDLEWDNPDTYHAVREKLKSNTLSLNILGEYRKALIGNDKL